MTRKDVEIGVLFRYIDQGYGEGSLWRSSLMYMGCRRCRTGYA